MAGSAFAQIIRSSLILVDIYACAVLRRAVRSSLMATSIESRAMFMLGQTGGAVCRGPADFPVGVDDRISQSASVGAESFGP